MALELINHLKQNTDPERSIWLENLYEEIEEDQKILKGLIDDLGSEESWTRNATAWVAEKFSRLKLQLSETSADLGYLQSLETLELGITGKKGLWKLLALISPAYPFHPALSFDELISRAERQLDEVENQRLKSAKSTFADSTNLGNKML